MSVVPVMMLPVPVTVLYSQGGVVGVGVGVPPFSDGVGVGKAVGVEVGVKVAVGVGGGVIVGVDVGVGLSHIIIALSTLQPSPEPPESLPMRQRSTMV